MKNKIINIIGLGYIGLPTSAILANRGFKVIGTDINEEVVKLINSGKSHISEPDLENHVKSAVKSGLLRASTSPQYGDVYIICVPTPFNQSGKIPEPNINHILQATISISSFIKSGDLLILESTSPVGTTEKIKTILQEAGVHTESIHIAYCPERVIPGKIMREIIENDRIVGGLTTEDTKLVAEFYRYFVKGKVLETDARTAEMCKLTENSYRDVNIAFANELSVICDKEGINIWNLIQLANHHPRVNVLQPSTGVGGHCIAVDPWFIISQNLKHAQLMHTARKVNNNKTNWVIEKIKLTSSSLMKKTHKRPIIACLGLAFKPDVADLRESPALEVVKKLKFQGYNLLCVEPNIEFYKGLTIVEVEQAIKQSDIIAILVKHKIFAKPSIQRKLMKKIILDFCGTLG